MKQFRRGIRNPAMLDALVELSEREGWWRDVIRDPSLVIGVRDEYLNVYWQGQSLFRVAMKGGRVTATTHPKYLLNPDLSGQVAIDVETNAFAAPRIDAIAQAYEPGVTLGRLKRAASLYSGEEKRGVHDIATANPNVVDVEIAFSGGDVTGGVVPRIDIAAFESIEGGVRLVFWEAKTFYNPELRSSGEKNVVRQIELYRSILDAFRDDVIESYRIIAANLAVLASASGGARQLDPVVRRVAEGGELVLGDPAELNLIVYGFDAAQRDKVWRPFESELRTKLAPGRIVARGDTKGLRL
ncbi:hypothetical protein ACFQ4O_01905 [Methylopila musalis]|uniref:Uncharacterized protein n=1 Tax=Methylopila musalis TaxID=1134781 RepID=A0ABW3Z3A6_9HYPH